MGATGGGRRADGAPIFPPHGHCGGADPGHGNKIEVGSCACLLAPDGFVVGLGVVWWGPGLSVVAWVGVSGNFVARILGNEEFLRSCHVWVRNL